MNGYNIKLMENLEDGKTIRAFLVQRAYPSDILDQQIMSEASALFHPIPKNHFVQIQLVPLQDYHNVFEVSVIEPRLLTSPAVHHHYYTFAESNIGLASVQEVAMRENRLFNGMEIKVSMLNDVRQSSLFS